MFVKKKRKKFAKLKNNDMMYLYEKSKKSVKNVALHNVTFFVLKKENKKACKIKKCVIIYSCAERWMPYMFLYVFSKDAFLYGRASFFRSLNMLKKYLESNKIFLTE